MLWRHNKPRNYVSDDENTEHEHKSITSNNDIFHDKESIAYEIANSEQFKGPGLDSTPLSLEKDPASD